MFHGGDFMISFLALAALIVVAAIAAGTVIVVAIRAYWVSRSASHHWLRLARRMDETMKGDPNGKR